MPKTYLFDIKIAPITEEEQEIINKYKEFQKKSIY